ncbi:MAG: hypothetical protein IBX55_18615 [Methyloprofundus sp.]|nr:hypothetical protein [Methyloprofundus sp.]
MVCIKPQKIKWSDSLDDIFRPLLFDDFDLIKNQVKTDICELWQIEGCGFTITRAELDHAGKPADFVFVVGVGQNALHVINHFRAGAKKQGFRAFRIHSRRVGMGRYLKKIGFKPLETVYSLELKKK